MAINQRRPDTPLASTPEARIDPPIKRTQTTDPETGATTYRQSWSSSSGSKSSSSGRKPSSTVKKDSKKDSGNAREKSTSSKSSTSGSREITSAPIPKPAGFKKSEITPVKMKADNKFVPKTRKEQVTQNKIDDYNKNKSSSETYDQYRKKTQDRANLVAKKNPTRSGGSRSFAPSFDCGCK